MNATSWVFNEGMDFLTNESNFNIINASLNAYTSPSSLGSGIASLFIFLFIPLLAGFIINLKLDNAPISGMFILILTFLFDNYGLYDSMPFVNTLVHKIIFFTVIITIGMSMIWLWNARN